MIRHRWLHAQWPMTMWELSAGLKERKFSNSSQDNDGFIIERVRDNFLEARHIERVQYQESIVDPFGDELSVNRITFNQCTFRASTDFPGFELINPPRTTQKLFSRLAQVTKFDLSIDSMTIDVLNWASYIQEIGEINAVVDLLQINNLEIARGVTAKAVVKGKQDIRQTIDQWMNGKNHKVEKVQLRLTSSAGGTLLLTNSGSVRIDSVEYDHLLSKIRSSLAKIDEWNTSNP